MGMGMQYPGAGVAPAMGGYMQQPYGAPAQQGFAPGYGYGQQLPAGGMHGYGAPPPAPAAYGTQSRSLPAGPMPGPYGAPLAGPGVVPGAFPPPQPQAGGFVGNPFGPSSTASSASATPRESHDEDTFAGLVGDLKKALPRSVTSPVASQPNGVGFLGAQQAYAAPMMGGQQMYAGAAFAAPAGAPPLYSPPASNSGNPFA